MDSDHGFGSWIRIMDSDHGFVSWIRIMDSYNGFVSWSRIMDSDHGFVSLDLVIALWGRIQDSYHGFVSVVSWVRIADSCGFAIRVFCRGNNIFCGILLLFINNLILVYKFIPN